MKNNKKIIAVTASILSILVAVVAVVKILGIKAEGEVPQGDGAVRSISLQSDGYAEGEPGSWHLEKSAEWTKADKARITFSVDSIRKRNKNVDVLLVLDRSGSMTGEKLEKMRSDSIELVEFLLADEKNNVGLIAFNDGAIIKNYFTNNKNNIINNINSIYGDDSTNYNDALKDADEIMKEYVKQPDRDVIILFLTDGYPNVDTPNQIATYKMLKSKYPYIEICGIQYEMGSQISEKIIEISDKQWAADMKTLNNVLFDAVIPSGVIEKYEVFEVEDLINNEYFTVDAIDNIKVTNGTVKLTEENGIQKITWTLDNSGTGIKANMYINITVKEGYQEGYYPTNKSTNVRYKIVGEEENIKQTIDTPILKTQVYSVIYDANEPEGKQVIDMPSNQRYWAFETITKAQNEPKCEGWNFKGWEIVEQVEKINEYSFIMPQCNVTIRAIWGKQEIIKSMSGTIAGGNLPQIGDTVYYSPNGQHQWVEEYSTDEGTDVKTLSSEEGGDFRITEWKVLDIDTEEGIVNIVPTTGTYSREWGNAYSNRNVSFYGAQGYNNIVYLLNKVCSNLYSDPDKGITARSINIDDIIKIIKEEGLYDDTILKESNNTGSYYGTGYYPVLYKYEKFSVVSDSGTLGPSEQVRLIEKNEGDSMTENIGTKSIENMKKLPYNYNCMIKKEKLGTRAEILFPEGISTSYLIATRYAHESYYTQFGAFKASGNYIEPYVLYGQQVLNSYFTEDIHTNQVKGAVFPVVSINLELLDEVSDGAFIVSEKEEEESSEDLKVGDIVRYSPSGTYEWNPTYISSYPQWVYDPNASQYEYNWNEGTDYYRLKKTLSSEQGGEFRITEWRVLNIDKENGKVDIVPISSTNSDRNVTLHGAQGYNNAVYILNEACNNLYSDSSKGITARSININDIEKIMREGYRQVPRKKDYGQYNYQNSYFPEIYGYEKLSTYHASDRTYELEQSEQTKLYQTGLTKLIYNLRCPYTTNYNFNNIRLKIALGNKKASILLPSDVSTCYWIASRCTDASFNGGLFQISSMKDGELTSFTVYDSENENHIEKSCGLFPIVSLSSDLLVKSEDEGVYEVN